MPLTDSDKLVFIHIGKTAGTSVKTLVSSQFSKKEICPAGHFYEFEELPEAERSKYRLFQGHLGWNQAVELGNRFMTFVRNPTDRYLSLYYYWRWLDRDNPEYARPTVDGRREWGLEVAKQYPLEEFAELEDRRIVADTRNTQVWQLAFDHGPARFEHRDIGEDELLAKAISNTDRMDFVGVVEDMPRSLALLDQAFAWQLPRRAPRHNATPNRPAIEDLKVSVRKKIYENTALDWELYSHCLKRFLKDAGTRRRP